MDIPKGIGWGAKETKNTSIDAQFNRKYKVKLNQIKLAEKRLNNMMKNGGGQVLSLEKYDKQVKKKLDELATKCSSQTYEQNLDAKLEFIEFKISLLTSSAAKSDLEASRTTAKSEQEKQHLDKVQLFIEKLVAAYNGASSRTEADDTKIKERAFEDKKKELANQISTSDQYIVFDTQSVEAQRASYTNEQMPIDQVATSKNREEAQKQLEEAYAKAKEGIEAANNLAKQNAKKTLETCKKSLQLADDELSRKAAIQAEKALQQAAADLAKLPDDIVKQFKQLESALQQLVTGVGDLNFMVEDSAQDMEMIVDAMISQMQSLIDPVFNTATSLSLPLPQIVAPVKDLMSLIPQMGKDPPGITKEQKELIEKYKKMNVQLPQNWADSLASMKDSLVTVMALFPICLVQLVFNMIDAIVSQIKALGGSAPYPLNLVPIAIQLMPRLIMLYVQFPQNLYKVQEKKMKDMVAQAMALGASTGSQIDGITLPTPSCPEAVKAELKKKIEEEKKAREEQQQLQRIQKQKELEQKLASSPNYKDNPEEAKKQAEVLAAIQTSKPKKVSDLEERENQKLCDEIMKEASIIKTNNSDDQPKDIANTPDSELSDDEKRQKKAECSKKSVDKSLLKVIK